MGVSYNRLWKMLIDKNMKRIEMPQSGKYSEIRDFGQGEFPLAAQMPIPNKVCD